MDETRRFLRYVVPGLVFATEVTLLLSILFPPQWIYHQIREFNGDKGLGVVLAGVLASGGLGFIFSAVHHSLHWRGSYGSIDHSGAILRLGRQGIIRFRDLESNEFTTVSEITRPEAWSILTTLWEQRIKSSAQITGADPTATALVDLVHSMGTAAVASFFSVLATVTIAAAVGRPSFTTEAILRFLATAIVSCTIWKILHSNYKRTGGFAQQLIDEVLTSALLAEFERDHQPIIARLNRNPQLPQTQE